MAYLYTMKVYPAGLGRDVYRVLEIEGSKTLDELCSKILQAFEFSQDHLYEFCMDNRPYSGNAYQSYPEHGQSSTKIRIDRLGLAKGQKFTLHYDFGDDWMFPITVQSIEETDRKASPVPLKSKGTVEQYPDWDDEWDEEDEDDDDGGSPEEAGDSEEDAMPEENARALAVFEKEIADLAPATIRRHVENVDLYINDYFQREDIRSIEDGAYCLYSFFDYFFIHKCMWSTPASIKTTAASLKKFYKCMAAHGMVSQEAYAFVCSEIKENMSDWQEECARYNDDL